MHKYFKHPAVKAFFGKFLWSFVDYQPIQNTYQTIDQYPNNSIVRSDEFISQKHGFKFVGSTIVYAHMQATGMVNDHLVSCFRIKR
ncbi:MAG: hypothetical protein CM15mP59_1100 [Flavobacteriaceae bacterium]|nr:MAG: hypothetical protein CM15mP59_1100 [Flavobacteriaceae bacterium]